MGVISPDDCSDTSISGCAYFDDCDICVGGTSGNTFNQDADCLGVCFGIADYDECGVCDGDNSSCNQPIAYYQTLTMDEDEAIEIVLQASDPNGDNVSYSIVSNPDNKNIKLGKAGRKRYLGFRPKVRGVVMNPVDHPHGGGEGRTSGGRHPVTPWGKSTKGKKTRNNKKTNVFILKRRKK